jgi:hypothetical protein
MKERTDQSKVTLDHVSRVILNGCNIYIHMNVYSVDLGIHNLMSIFTKLVKMIKERGLCVVKQHSLVQTLILQLN